MAYATSLIGDWLTSDPWSGKCVCELMGVGKAAGVVRGGISLATPPRLAFFEPSMRYDLQSDVKTGTVPCTHFGNSPQQ